MATVTTQAVALTGAALTYANASSGGDRFTPGVHVLMHVKNGSEADVDVTLATPGTVDGLAVADRVVTVPASGDRHIPLPNTYKSSDGLGDVAWESATSVTFAVFEH